MAKQRSLLIDSIPKYTQQPRSPAPKRRTDFSLFFCSSLSNRDSLLGSSFGMDGLSCVTMTDSGGRKDGVEKLPQFPMVQRNKALSRGPSLVSNFIEVPVIEVESVAQNALLEPHSDRSVGEAKSDSAGGCEISPQNLQTTQSNDVCISPMNTELHGKENSSSCRQLFGSPDVSNDSSQPYHSCDWRDSSISSSTNSDLLGRRRGQRERKPKVHFDEVTLTMKSSRKARRIKIMRYLGLTPPAGSPF